MPLEISRDRSFETHVWDSLTAPLKYNSRSKDLDHVNVSDLTYCIRKGYFSKMHGEKKENKDYDNFVRGLMSELYMTMRTFKDYESQSDIVFEDLVKGHPDLLSLEKSHVIELKDSNNAYSFCDPRAKKFNSFPSYLLQILYYMAMTEVECGTILVKHSNSKLILDKLRYKKHAVERHDTIPFRAYSFHIPKDDPMREEIKSNLRFKAVTFLKAVKQKNVKILPIIRDAHSEDSKCNYCPYKQSCHSPENADTEIYDDNVKEMLREDYILKKIEVQYQQLGKLI